MRTKVGRTGRTALADRRPARRIVFADDVDNRRRIRKYADADSPVVDYQPVNPRQRRYARNVDPSSRTAARRLQRYAYDPANPQRRISPKLARAREQWRQQMESAKPAPSRASRIIRPGSGFGLRQTGAVPTTRDYNPYERHRTARTGDRIWQALMTEGGRQAIGAAMANPIRTELDYQGVTRRFLEIDVLAQGQVARYDRDITGLATVVAKRAQVVEHIIEGEYVEPTTWEIFSPASIRLSEIQQRRFNVLDRMQEKIRIHTQIEEDSNFLMLLATTAAANVAVNPYTTGTAGVSKTLLNNLSAQVQKHDLPAYALMMNFQSYADIRGWTNTEVDPVTMREIQQSGLYAQIWGIDIIVSRLVSTGRVWCLTEPRMFGVLPIRTDMMVMPDDRPREARIGYVGYEEIGMTIVNANGLSRANFTG